MRDKRERARAWGSPDPTGHLPWESRGEGPPHTPAVLGQASLGHQGPGADPTWSGGRQLAPRTGLWQQPVPQPRHTGPRGPAPHLWSPPHPTAPFGSHACTAHGSGSVLDPPPSLHAHLGQRPQESPLAWPTRPPLSLLPAATWVLNVTPPGAHGRGVPGSCPASCTGTRSPGSRVGRPCVKGQRHTPVVAWRAVWREAGAGRVVRVPAIRWCRSPLSRGSGTPSLLAPACAWVLADVR